VILTTSAEKIELLQRTAPEGASMIAISREILSVFSDDPLYDSGEIDEFIAIDDQTDHLVLTGYGKFDRPSPRVYEWASKAPRRVEHFKPGDAGYSSELATVFALFGATFEKARQRVLAIISSEVPPA
jgi:hypothetical protein